MKEEFKICREAAQQFFEIAKENSQTPDMLISNMYCVVVNITFSCELFIKAILLYHKKEIFHEHKLKVLFEKLPDMVKKEIEKQYSKDLDKLLTEINDKFIEWRYPHERMVNINITDTMEFAKTLCKYVYDING